jgi:hypothetical protein
MGVQGDNAGLTPMFGGWPNQTSKLLFRVPRSSFAWAGLFGSHHEPKLSATYLNITFA